MSKAASQTTQVWLPDGVAHPGLIIAGDLSMVLSITDTGVLTMGLWAEVEVTPLLTGDTLGGGDSVTFPAGAECTLDVIRLEGSAVASALSAGARHSGLRDGDRTVAGSAVGAGAAEAGSGADNY